MERRPLAFNLSSLLYPSPSSHYGEEDGEESTEDDAEESEESEEKESESDEESGSEDSEEGHEMMEVA